MPRHLTSVLSRCRAGRLRRIRRATTALRATVLVAVAPAVFPFLAFACLAASGTPGSPPDFSESEGVFRVEKRNGAWTFVDPAGRPFVARAVNGVVPEWMSERPDLLEWAPKTRDRLASLGFNALGAANSGYGKRVFRMPCFALATPSEGARFRRLREIALERPKGVPPPSREEILPLPDVWSPLWRNGIDRALKAEWRQALDDPNCIAFQPDYRVEAPRRDLWTRDHEYLLRALREWPLDSPGRREALRFLRERHGGRVDSLNVAWEARLDSWDALTTRPVPAPFGFDTGEPFIATGPSTGTGATRPRPDPLPAGYRADSLAYNRFLLSAYFDSLAAAARRVAPGRLIASPSICHAASDWVFVEAAARFDVLAVTAYTTQPALAVARVAGLVDRPVLVSEFAVRGADVETPAPPAFHSEAPVEPTQAARAAAVYAGLSSLGEVPAFVGYQWANRHDTRTGTRVVENVGLAKDRDGTPYELLGAALKRANRELEFSRR